MNEEDEIPRTLHTLDKSPLSQIMKEVNSMKESNTIYIPVLENSQRNEDDGPYCARHYLREIRKELGNDYKIEVAFVPRLPKESEYYQCMKYSEPRIQAYMMI